MILLSLALWVLGGYLMFYNIRIISDSLKVQVPRVFYIALMIFMSFVALIPVWNFIGAAGLYAYRFFDRQFDKK